MRGVGCTLKLAEDKDDPYTPRTGTLSINDDNTWSVMSETGDPRLKIGADGGGWGINEYPVGSGAYVMYLFDLSSYQVSPRALPDDAQFP